MSENSKVTIRDFIDYSAAAMLEIIAAGDVNDDVNDALIGIHTLVWDTIGEDTTAVVESASNGGNMVGLYVIERIRYEAWVTMHGYGKMDMSKRSINAVLKLRMMMAGINDMLDLLRDASQDNADIGNGEDLFHIACDCNRGLDLTIDVADAYRDRLFSTYSDTLSCMWMALRGYIERIDPDSPLLESAELRKLSPTV